MHKQWPLLCFVRKSGNKSYMKIKGEIVYFEINEKTKEKKNKIKNCPSTG